MHTQPSPHPWKKCLFFLCLKPLSWLSWWSWKTQILHEGPSGPCLCALWVLWQYIEWFWARRIPPSNSILRCKLTKNNVRSLLTWSMSEITCPTIACNFERFLPIRSAAITKKQEKWSFVYRLFLRYLRKLLCNCSPLERHCIISSRNCTL